MTITDPPLTIRSPTRWSAAPLVGDLLALMPILIAAALLQHAVLLTNPDVAWLLTVGERVAAGERLYVDILETNPPLSAWLYWPALAAGRLIGGGAEAWTVTLVLAAATVAVLLAARILRRAGVGAADGAPSVLAGGLALMLLPLAAFAEREHLALIGLWPLFAALVVRAEGGRPGGGAILVIGAAAALAVAVKPHFALALALPALWLAWRARSPWILFRPELVIAAVGSGLVFAASLAVHPEYLQDMLPLVAETYRPVRAGLAALLGAPAALAVWAMAIGLVLAAGPRLGHPAVAVPLLAAAGFALGYLEQGKGWPYHLLPASGLLAASTLALAPGAFAQGLHDRRVTMAAGALAAILGLALAAAGLRTDDREMRRLAEIVATTAPKPAVGLISAEIALGHPLVRMVDGRLVGSVCSLWMSGGAIRLGFADGLPAEQAARLEQVQTAERQRMAREFGADRPDAILVERGFDWLGWTRAEPALAAILADYREIGATDHAMVLARKTAAVRPPSPSGSP